ncbi:MAG: 4Fe-4S dicluster domain-containing protein, partial [Methanomassiliicoccales archaeon]
IGCYMCPASDLGEMSMVEERCGEFREWKERLHRFAEERGLPREWVEFGLWRWRSPPSSLMKELDRLGHPVEADRTGAGRWTPSVSEGEGEVRASLPRELDLERVGNLMNILGEVERRGGSVSANGATVLEEGRIHASGDTPVARKRMEMAHRVVVKAMDCLSCGVCLGLCPEGALDLGEEGVTISEGLCSHCGECMEPCPVLGFRDDFDL